MKKKVFEQEAESDNMYVVLSGKAQEFMNSGYVKVKTRVHFSLSIKV